MWNGAAAAAYRDMVTEVRQTLANLGEHFPTYQGQGFEIAGFVWFHGWNDMADPDYNPVYAEHLAHFIRDVRARLQDAQSSVRHRSDGCPRRQRAGHERM